MEQAALEGARRFPNDSSIRPIDGHDMP